MFNQINKELPAVNHDPRVSSLLFESNISYMLDEISKIFFKTDLLTGRKIGSERQLTLLVSFKLITKGQKENIERMREIRNLLAHSTNIFSTSTKNQFNSKVDKLPIFKNKELEGREIQKFEAFCATLILSLYRHYTRIHSKFANKKLYS